MRTHYRNGDQIDMAHNGCDGCSPSIIQGVLCHERGCPFEWKDEMPRDVACVLTAEEEFIEEYTDVSYDDLCDPW